MLACRTGGLEEEGVLFVLVYRASRSRPSKRPVLQAAELPAFPFTRIVTTEKDLKDGLRMIMQMQIPVTLLL